jgi:L-threonylcarbamoyladenylate synthase
VSALVVTDDTTGYAEAIRVLRAGGIVALPTDTVYGIGVALDAERGIERLFEAKRRPADRAVMLLLDSADQARAVGQWPPAAAALADAFWPGGLTVVVEQLPGAGLPPELTGGTPTIGLRMPDHACPRALAAAIGPLPVTSANLSGSPPARDAAEIAAQLGDAVDCIVEGGPAP